MEIDEANIKRRITLLENKQAAMSLKCPLRRKVKVGMELETLRKLLADLG